MAINPIVPLAYNLADVKKRYVLFCGAGISKDAEIPTGQDIFLETLRLLRTQEEEKNVKYSVEEMETYYKEKYEGATYSDVIGGLFPSQEEQREFLKAFFEGKSPGRAHKLIAEWVKQGLVRFIITTNFDPLIEHALDEIGLKGKYSVISTGEQVLSSTPWSNVEDCRIYKIHGTIEQGKIRNTEKDLSELDEDIGKDFLDIIERHGVIVLGYSGNDKAVMNFFNKRRFKGYTLYWTAYRGDIPLNVEKLIKNQDGLVINIESASEFLEEVLNRVEIAKKGIEQSTEAVAKTGFKNLITSGSDVEIAQTIDEKRSELTNYFKNILEEVDEKDYKSLWEGYVKTIKYSMNFLLLAEQVIKYKIQYWKNITPVFNEIQSLNEYGDRHGKNGLTNYLFYSMLEIIGAILLANNSFKQLNSMLEIKRLNRRKDGMENILDWNIQAQFIETKNSEESKESGQSWIVPKMHYLLQLLESQELPFEIDLKKWIIEVDLLYFVYSMIYPVEKMFPYWFPNSPPYLDMQSTDTLKQIKLDEDFGEKIAGELFKKDYDELIRELKKAKNTYDEEISLSYRGAGPLGNPFSDF